jgi:hypothetical protein
VKKVCRASKKKLVPSKRAHPPLSPSFGGRLRNWFLCLTLSLRTKVTEWPRSRRRNNDPIFTIQRKLHFSAPSLIHDADSTQLFTRVNFHSQPRPIRSRAFRTRRTRLRLPSEWNPFNAVFKFVILGRHL